jgi:tetratricopeptide (TPR) repeat protein
MVSIYQKFNKADWFDKNNHDTKLQMLTFLVNSFSRNGKVQKSLDYAEELGREIENYNRLHYHKFVFYYYNARVINYSESAPGKALEALKELEEVMKGKPNTYYEMFIHLNRGILYFKTGRYNDAIRSFVKYYTNEYYKKSDNLFKLRVGMAELMMQVESKDKAGIKIRLEQLRKQFKAELDQPDAYAEKALYSWIRLLGKNELNYKDPKLQSEAVRITKDKKMKLAEDSQLLNYQAWLQTKIKP